MQTNFVKIYGDNLLNSTLWLECWQSRLVFIGLLAAADYEGMAHFPSVASLSHRLNLPQEDVRKGLAVLEAPDLESRSKELEGRRVVKVDGGWQLVNYVKYREARTRKQVLTAERVAKHRAKGQVLLPVTRVTSDKDLDLDLEKEKSERRARERPAQVDRLPEAEQGFTDRRMRSLFIAEFEAVQRATPSMNGKNVGDFHAMVCRTASLQGLDAETQFVDLVRAWLGNPLTETELRAPYACLAQAWGGLAATGTRKTSEASTETVEGLRLAAGAALDRGDMEGMRRIGARITEIENAAEKGLRRGR